jgi:hypothetical protein
VDAFLKVIRRSSEEEYNDWTEAGSRIEVVDPHNHAGIDRIQHSGIR